MQLARVDRCVFGAADPKGGALGTLFNVHNDARLNHHFEVTAGVCEQECAALLSDFFASLRARRIECADGSVPDSRKGALSS
jgi:tRNA(Arg) A34 adenosine deaminase TadA